MARIKHYNPDTQQWEYSDISSAISPVETTPEDIVEWMCEINVITPVASSNGEIYTTNDGKILVL